MTYRCISLVLLLTFVGIMGCTSSNGSDACPVSRVEQMLPADPTGDFKRISVADNLGTDFYRILLDDEGPLLSSIESGLLATHNSTRIPGATMEILIIQFRDPENAGTAAYTLQNVVKSATSTNATLEEIRINQNNISYSSLRVTGLTNIHGVEFYQEFVFWQVHRYTVMAKLTTPVVLQDPHASMQEFMDAMAEICAP
jgi:hypothetical protein